MYMIIYVSLNTQLVSNVSYTKESIGSLPWISKMLNGKGRLSGVEMLEQMVDVENWRIVGTTMNESTLVYTLQGPIRNDEPLSDEDEDTMTDEPSKKRTRTTTQASI